MSSVYNYIRSSLNASKQLPDFASFHLISKMPSLPDYNLYRFIPTLHKTEEKPQEGLHFNHKIGCADDITYFGVIDCEKQAAEYRALGINERIKSAIMQASSNLVTAKAKYIVISSVGLGYKYGNPNVFVFENEHSDADPNLRIEYQIENYIS